jgi:hypothetical protein
MKTVCIKISDKLLKNVFSKIFNSFGMKVVAGSKADFLFEEFDDYFLLNGEKRFLKPLDILSFMEEFGRDVSVDFFGARLFVDKKKLLKNSVEIFFTDIEFKILIKLFEEKKGVGVDDLVIWVFGRNNESSVKSLSTHIYNLKKKLAELFGKQKNILLENSRYKLDL